MYIETMGTGLGWIDYDQDGLMDLYLVQTASTDWYKAPRPLRSALYRNKGDGTGAVLKLTSEGVTQVEQAKGGMGYMSANDLRIHFGLGERKTITSLEITWLSGTVDKLTNVPINQVITVKEGAGIVPGNFPKVPGK
jgi:hypothetical protein